ncbi:MAG: DNA polymerase IV, partial [Ruminococcus sp.]
QILSDSVARRMRELGFKAGVVTISVRDNQLFSFTRQGQLSTFSNHTRDIRDKALELFRRNYNFKKPIRSLGVSVSKLVADTSPCQLSFFQDCDKDIREENLDKTLDSLKNRFGNYAVRPAFLIKDKKLSLLNPKDDHTIHPVGFF